MRLSFLLGAAVMTLSVPAQASGLTYPETRKVDVVEDQFGVKVAAPLGRVCGTVTEFLAVVQYRFNPHADAAGRLGAGFFVSESITAMRRLIAVYDGVIPASMICWQAASNRTLLCFPSPSSTFRQSRNPCASSARPSMSCSITNAVAAP